MHTWRIPIGFLVAPIAPCYIGAMVLGDPDIQSAWRIALLMIFVCWLVSFLVALPAYLVLQRSGYVSLAKAVAAGFLIALSVSLVVFLLPSGPGDYAGGSAGPTMVAGHLTALGWRNALEGSLATGGLGAAVGAVFWLAACWKLR